MRFWPHHRKDEQPWEVKSIFLEFCLLGLVSLPNGLPVEKLVQVFRRFNGLVSRTGGYERGVSFVDGRHRFARVALCSRGGDVEVYPSWERWSFFGVSVEVLVGQRRRCRRLAWGVVFILAAFFETPLFPSHSCPFRHRRDGQILLQIWEYIFPGLRILIELFFAVHAPCPGGGGDPIANHDIFLLLRDVPPIAWRRRVRARAIQVGEGCGHVDCAWLNRCALPL